MGGRGASGGRKINGSNQNGLTSKENLLISGIPQGERGDFYVHHGVNSSYLDYIKRQGAENAAKDLKDVARYDSILVNISLPKLNGTEKQIAYAEDIRTRYLNRVLDSKVNAIRDRSQSQKDALIAQANSQGAKATTVSDVINFTFKLDKKYKKIMGMTSAKEIIESLR